MEVHVEVQVFVVVNMAGQVPVAEIVSFWHENHTYVTTY